MSSGYTRAFASTAPVAPATALPQGERRCGFDWPAMRVRKQTASYLSVYRNVPKRKRGAVAPQPLKELSSKKTSKKSMKRRSHNDTKNQFAGDSIQGQNGPRSTVSGSRARHGGTSKSAKGPDREPRHGRLVSWQPPAASRIARDHRIGRHFSLSRLFPGASLRLPCRLIHSAVHHPSPVPPPPKVCGHYLNLPTPPLGMGLGPWVLAVSPRLRPTPPYFGIAHWDPLNLAKLT
jgi:hypothetical protein